MDVKQYLKTLKLIHVALVMGQIVFATIVFVLHQSTFISFEIGSDVFLIVVPIVFLGGLAVGNFLFKNFVSRIADQQTLNEKLNAYRTALIIRYALLEAPVLVALIAYFLTANFLYLLIAVIIILYFITLKPTKSKIENDLNLQYKEKDEFDRALLG